MLAVLQNAIFLCYELSVLWVYNLDNIEYNLIHNLNSSYNSNFKICKKSSYTVHFTYLWPRLYQIYIDLKNAIFRRYVLNFDKPFGSHDVANIQTSVDIVTRKRRQLFV